MNYEEAIDFLFNSLPVWESLGGGAYKPGLERITRFLEKLGDPHKKLRVVHVAGTNGKGSTCHMLASVLQASSYKSGLFTSPHLVDFRERMRVDGQMIPREAVVEFTEKWRGEMVTLGLTFFEMTTAMGLWWFEREGVDAAVVEAGLGGRLDSTNVVEPMLSVITNIGLEHTQYLGVTLEAIAGEKAGIIKRGVPVVVGEVVAQTAPVFRARAEEMGSELVVAEEIAADYGDYELDLKGDYQRKNLATVLAAVKILRADFKIPEYALRKGLSNTVLTTGLRGRWQVVRRDPLVVLDTAHNAHGLEEVVRQIERQKFDKLLMVIGLSNDKDIDAIVPLLPQNAHYILTRAATPRAMDVERLAEKFLGSTSTKTVAEAIEIAIGSARKDDMIFVGGSNFVVAEALAMLDC